MKSRISEEPVKACILDAPVTSSTKMIKAGMDTDVDLSSGVRIRARKRSFGSDSILRVDVKIICTQLEGDSRRPSE